MDTRNSNKSWDDLARRAAAEHPQPDIDVRFSVRRQIEAEASTRHRESSNLLDEIATITRARWAVPAAAAVILLVWQFTPTVRELAFALELQSQLLTGL
jgi:anti-sigma-K factor RskA